MARKTFAFSVRDAIPAAWKFLWEDNLRVRAEGRDWRGGSYYLTAADVENQVRQFADDTASGVPWGSTRACGRPMTMVRISGDLQGAVRNWLLGNGQLQSHNFKRGHISGMRFRPVGAPLAPSEQKTFEKLAKPPTVKPIHLRSAGGPKCTAARRSGFGRHSSRGPMCSTDPIRVTCQRCLNALAAEKV